MIRHRDATFIDTTGTVHQFTWNSDELGNYYTWADVTGYQYAFLRDVTMSFDLWIADTIRGICIAIEVT